jgi:hypothetical protein
MLQDYMGMMGLIHEADEYYSRLMYINLTNDPILQDYCHVITTVYDRRNNSIHWTEGLSYSRNWIEDHLTKTNLLLNNYNRLVLKKNNSPKLVFPQMCILKNL